MDFGKFVRDFVRPTDLWDRKSSDGGSSKEPTETSASGSEHCYVAHEHARNARTTSNPPINTLPLTNKPFSVSQFMNLALGFDVPRSLHSRILFRTEQIDTLPHAFQIDSEQLANSQIT